ALPAFALLTAWSPNAHAQAMLTAVTDEAPAGNHDTPNTAQREIRQVPPQGSIPAPAASDAPLEVTADNSLEWHRNEKSFIASGNAVATQGDMSVSADKLTAHYSDNSGGGMKISRV